MTPPQDAGLPASGVAMRRFTLFGECLLAGLLVAVAALPVFTLM